MASLRSVPQLGKFISKLASLLKKHLRMNTGVYLFATFLEMLATYKLVGKVIARQRAIIARRIRATRETEFPEHNRSNTVRSGIRSPFLEVKAPEMTSPSSESG